MGLSTLMMCTTFLFVLQDSQQVGLRSGTYVYVTSFGKTQGMSYADENQDINAPIRNIPAPKRRGKGGLPA